MKKSNFKFKANEMDDTLKKKKEETKASLVTYLKSQGIDEPAQQAYLNEDSSNDRRPDRLALMMRIRNSINRANQAKNMWARSYYVVKYALYNLYRYSNDARLVETGY
jgi:alpha-N-acetylglucosamine transferase